MIARKHKKWLHELALEIHEPNFPLAFKTFLYSRRHPTRIVPANLDSRFHFTGRIDVFHSAIARFYAPSDLCGAGGMYRQRIRSNPSWYGMRRHDTVFVVRDENVRGIQGLNIARLRLLFSFTDDNTGEEIPCALVSWYSLVSDAPDPDTRMWVVKAEGTRHHRPVQVIHLNTIARAAHLLPKYGVGVLPEKINHTNSLDKFNTFYVNPFVDHHCHEFLST